MKPQDFIQQDAEEALDTYLKELTAEQQFHFDAWLEHELKAKRIPNNPDAFSLKILARGWAAGWTSSRSALVQGVHDL